MRLLEDRVLRRAFAAGCRDALAEVYREYSPAVAALLSRGFTFRSGERWLHAAGCTDASELDDLMQEVFTRAFTDRARAAYDGVRPYRNYLFTIARNLVTERRRSAVVRLERASGTGFADRLSAEHAQHPEHAMSSRELALHMAEFMAGLEPAELAVFEARFQHGHSIEAAAVVLGLSQHRVKCAERLLRKRLLHALRRHGYDG
jgi:RNA polymerase sigma-70 factor (ECF subfamily)